MCNISLFFFSNDSATTEIYTLSLHDALPISSTAVMRPWNAGPALRRKSARTNSWPSRCANGHWSPWHEGQEFVRAEDRKSTRLNSSHLVISYAVFCLKKKKTDRGRQHCNDTY